MTHSENSVLGKKVEFPTRYAPEVLYPIARKSARELIGIHSQDLPFHGADLWTAYELSWLDNNGVPQVALGNFVIPCQSEFILESKSLKLYLNSLNQSPFASWDAFKTTICQDMSQACHGDVGVKLFALDHPHCRQMLNPEGDCIDQTPIQNVEFSPDASLLKCSDNIVREKLFSNLLKSNCRITSQPDWGSLQIKYQGGQIERASLLRYILGFRLHDEFHEPLVEKIYMDIMQQLKPEKLSVYARYTRRGGLDINPFRSNCENAPRNIRHVRQ